MTTKPLSASDTTPAYWRGTAVPPILAFWFDQLVSQTPILEIASQQSYVDVLLTAGRDGAYARPPQITLK